MVAGNTTDLVTVTPEYGGTPYLKGLTLVLLTSFYDPPKFSLRSNVNG